MRGLPDRLAGTAVAVGVGVGDGVCVGNGVFVTVGIGVFVAVGSGVDNAWGEAVICVIGWIGGVVLAQAEMIRVRRSIPQ